MARRPIRNYKCYTLSVLAAGLAVSAAVSMVLALTSPARIFFSVTSFTRESLNTSSDDAGWLRMSFNLTANNTSPSASVRYRSIYVLVCNIGSKGSEGGACIGTDLTPLLPHQEPGSSKRIDGAVVELEGASSPWVTLGVMPSVKEFGGDTVVVIVSTLVRFKRPGVPWSSLHGINVSCGPITTFDSFQANQSAAADYVVKCVG